MNLRQLEVFQAIVKTGNMSAAAKLISITPSAVSKAIAHAELQLGYRLFERSKHGLTLTSSGRVLQQEAQAVYERLDLLRQTSRNLRHTVKGRLLIGAIPSICHEFMPRVLHKYSQLYPDVEIEVRTLHPTEIPKALDSHALELALSYYAIKIPHIQSEILISKPFYIVVRQDIWNRAMRLRPTQPMSFLAKVPWIRLTDDDPMAAPLELLSQQWGQRQVSNITVQTSRLALELVHRGMGWTTVDFLTASNLDPQLMSAVALHDMPLIPLCWHKLEPSTLSNPAQAMLEITKQLLLSDTKQ
jgi:DNA-binding transcriptional LysR family regulator